MAQINIVYPIKKPVAEIRGWRHARQKYVCCNCVNDSSFKNLINEHATLHEK